MLKFFILFAFIPLMLFANTDNEYAKDFAANLSAKNFEECHQILIEWELDNPSVFPELKALKAALSLAEGDLEKSLQLFDQSLEELRFQGMEEETIQFMQRWYEKAVEFGPNEPSVNEYFSKLQGNSLPIFLCKNKQPKGVQFKYWFGVAQIVTGCLVAPFSAGAGGTLILTGVSTVASATADSLNNMEEWEKNLNERQRINPDNLPPTQKNLHIFSNEKKCTLIIVSNKLRTLFTVT
jgi:hypothetical protein